MSSDVLKVEIITPDKKYEYEDISAFFAPGKIGKFEIMPHHAPLIAELAVGVISLVKNGNRENFAVSGGYCEVNNNLVKVFAESAEKEEEIDVDRAEQAKKRAEERLKRKNRDIDVERARYALARAINRLKLKHK